MTHANALLTPKGRLRLAQTVVDDGWTLARAAGHMGGHRRRLVPVHPWRLRAGPSMVAVLERAADFSTATTELRLPVERA